MTLGLHRRRSIVYLLSFSCNFVLLCICIVANSYQLDMIYFKDGQLIFLSDERLKGSRDYDCTVKLTIPLDHG